MVGCGKLRADAGTARQPPHGDLKTRRRASQLCSSDGPTSRFADADAELRDCPGSPVHRMIYTLSKGCSHSQLPAASLFWEIEADALSILSICSLRAVGASPRALRPARQARACALDRFLPSENASGRSGPPPAQPGLAPVRRLAGEEPRGPRASA